MPEKVSGNNFSDKSDLTSLNSNHTSIEPKSAVQLNSTEQKLDTLQKMADDSPYSQRFAHLTSMANNSIQKQPVSQLSKDSHSLPDNVKQGVESLSGISMDDVKVHYNSAKPAQLNAHAFAQGTDIHIASGQEKHLPHEAWHVVQQKQGRVQPTTMMKAKVPINDDQDLEKEADVMGARALQMKTFSLSDYMTEKSVQRKGIIQRNPLTTIPEGDEIYDDHEIEGHDPIKNDILIDQKHVNDLLYGLTDYRKATQERMEGKGEAVREKLRTVDQYNEEVGISGNLMSPGSAPIGIYYIREFLQEPSSKKIPGAKCAYPDSEQITKYQNGDGNALTNVQKWMTFLVREKHNIGLWDLGNTKPAKGKGFIGQFFDGEAEGLTKIKSKRRFEKNMDEKDKDKDFNEKDVHEMLSFGLDKTSAIAYYATLIPDKKSAIGTWIMNAFFRRTSKLGIDFATSEISLNARIHFNLTSGEKIGTGWQAKLWGILDDVAKDSGKRKITESEWRYVKRLMEKDPERLEKILIYSERKL